MSKYDPLFRHLSHSEGVVELQFRDVEEILGFALPASARRHAAWWSNSGGTHVQSAAWQAAGYRTEDVNVGQEKLRFVPDRLGGFAEMKQSEFTPDPAPRKLPAGDKKPYRHPAWGAMKGMITLLPDVDLTAPAYEDWKKLYGEEK